MAADILGQVLGEVRDDASLSTQFEQAHGFWPVLACRGRHHSLNLPYLATIQLPHIGPSRKPLVNGCMWRLDPGYGRRQSGWI
jgi:hypothetical protein